MLSPKFKGLLTYFPLLQSELEHRTPKKWYLRTSKKAFLRQITQIERRQARIRRIRSHLNHDRDTKSDEESDVARLSEAETPWVDPAVRYHIGKTQNNPEHITSFIQKNERDPAIKVSLVSIAEIKNAF